MSRDLNADFTLNNWLFGSVVLTKNVDPDKYKYSSYGIGFDYRSELSFTDTDVGKNVIIFGADLKSSVHIDNKNKNILIFGGRPKQGLNDNAITAEAKYPINFIQSGKRFALNLHYNGRNSLSLVNVTKIYQFKATDSEINPYQLCLGGVSKDFIINKMKKKQDLTEI